MFVPFLGNIPGCVVAVEPDWKSDHTVPFTRGPPMIATSRLRVSPWRNYTLWALLNTWYEGEDI